MIKTLIFDFGDVFINLNKQAAYDYALKTFKIDAFTDDMIATNTAYEKGLISSNGFALFYKIKFPHIDDTKLVKAWNYILKDFPKYRLDFLLQLKASSTYNLILLSNTNEMHINWIKKQVPFYNTFKSSFNAFYLSHEIHLRKPDRAIFEFVLEQHKLNPKDCLFIDDLEENTNAASKLGMKTWTLNPITEDVVNLFKTPHFKL